MANLPRNTLVFANRDIPTGNTITNATNAKGYFANKRTILANTSSSDAVWFMKAIGSYKSGTVASSIALRLEFARTLTIATSGTLTPALSVTKEQWEMEFWITKAAATGTIIANGRAGMALSVGSGIIVQSMMGGPMTGIDVTKDIDVEISAQWTAFNSVSPGSSITLEQLFWEEKRQI